LRILFTTQPAHGHLHWLVSLARTLASRGHEVLFAVSPSFRGTVEAFGFRTVGVGLDWMMTAGFHRLVESFLPELKGQPAGPQRRDYFVAHFLGGVTARKTAADLIPMLKDHPVDMVIHDQYEFGGCIAAEALGIPHAAMESTLFYPDARFEEETAVLDAIRKEHGLPPDPDGGMLFRYLLLSCIPPSLQYPNISLPSTLACFQPTIPESSGDTLPPWGADLGARPLVHATMGTVVDNTHAVYLAILAGLEPEAEALDLVLAVGQQYESAWPKLASHVHLERYVPHSLLLPRCSLVMTHGSLNTSMWTLSYGIPLVVIPFQTDQPINAARFTALGAARTLDHTQLTPALVRATVTEMLADPAYARGAKAVQASIRALPPVGAAAEAVEHVARERVPFARADVAPLRSEHEARE
jgi:MGT family glycosyltransferase